MHSSGGLHHHQLHSGGQPVLIQLPAGVDGAQATTYVLDAAGNVTLSGPNGNILTVDGRLVQGHAEVHLTDERGNVQQVAYATYANAEDAVALAAESGGLANVVVETGNQATSAVVSGEDYTTVMQAIENEDGTVSLAQGDAVHIDIDSSYHFFDNLRGKINNKVLTDLVLKYDAEDPSLSKNERLHKWSAVAQDYQAITGQNKNRTILMKRWSSAKYYREHEGRTVEEGGRVKGRVMKKEASESGTETKLSVLERNLKEYEILQLEAARLERDAFKTLMENASLKQAKIRKEMEAAGIEVNIAKLELAIKQEEARKLGLVVQFEGDEEEGDQLFESHTNTDVEMQ